MYDHVKAVIIKAHFQDAVRELQAASKLNLLEKQSEIDHTLLQSISSREKVNRYHCSKRSCRNSETESKSSIHLFVVQKLVLIETIAQ